MKINVQNLWRERAVIIGVVSTLAVEIVEVGKHAKSWQEYVLALAPLIASLLTRPFVSPVDAAGNVIAATPPPVPVNVGGIVDSLLSPK